MSGGRPRVSPTKPTRYQRQAITWLSTWDRRICIGSESWEQQSPWLGAWLGAWSGACLGGSGWAMRWSSVLHKLINSGNASVALEDGISGESWLVVVLMVKPALMMSKPAITPSNDLSNKIKNNLLIKNKD